MPTELVEYKRGRERGNAHRPLTHSLDYGKEGLGMNPTQEQWRPVVGYEGLYEVSDHGRVRSVDRIVKASFGSTRHEAGRVLALGTHKSGRRTVNLYMDTKRKTVSVERLVAEAFIGPRPEGLAILHFDDDRNNNRPSNLRYGTQSENMYDAVRNGVHNNAKKTHCVRGHEYSDANTAIEVNSSGGPHRKCRQCKRDRERARYARHVLGQEADQ